MAASGTSCVLSDHCCRGGNLRQPLIQRFIDETPESINKHELVAPTRDAKHLQFSLASGRQFHR